MGGCMGLNFYLQNIWYIYAALCVTVTFDK